MLRTVPFYLLAIIAVFGVKNNVFFWDTIQLGAKHANWYYDHNFRYLLLPVEIDSGHPPLFGIFLASMWKLFGKSLPVSHFSMLPFLVGIIFLGHRLARQLAADRFVPFLLLLFVADPTLAAQSLLISPDIVLVFGFLLGVHGVLSRQTLLKSIAALLLAMISLRGMMIVVVLFLFDALQDIAFKEKRIEVFTRSFLFKKAGPFVPSGLFALTFLAYHYSQTGWIGYHADSPWAPGFERVDAGGLIYNIGILGWRLLDFGRIFVWLAGAILLFNSWKKQNISPNTRKLLLLLGITLIVLSPSMLLHKGLLLHRYLLPVSLSLSLLVFHLLFENSGLSSSAKTVFFSLIFAGLLSGNLWIYPKHIAQGWDATLAHLPYYELRARMLSHIQTSDTTYQQVGTAFPEIGPLKFRDLSGRETGMVEKDLSKQKYIYYSNIMNDFSDEELVRLSEEWQVVRKLEKRGVCVILFRRP